MIGLRFFSPSDIISIGYIASGVGALVEKYKRLDGEEIKLTEDEKYTLENAKNFVDAIEKGFQNTQEPHRFSANAFHSATYNCYVTVRLRFPFKEIPQTIDEIRNEILEFKTVLDEMMESFTLDKIGKGKIEKVGLFFSNLGKMALEQMYILDQEKDSEREAMYV